jgi:hypothetical protein
MGQAERIAISLGAQLSTIAGLFLAAGAVAWSLHRVELRVSRRLSHHYGWKSVLVTGWLGTSVHELSHMLACKLFGLRIVDYKLYQPDTRTGTLGYVYYVQDGKGIWKAISRLAVATAPLFVGTTLTTCGLLLLAARPVTGGWAGSSSSLPAEVPSLFLAIGADSLLGLRGLARVEQLTNPWFWAWSYLALSVGLHMAPSRADMRNTAAGFLLIGLVFLCVLAGARFMVGDLADRLFDVVHAAAVPVAVASLWTLLLGCGYWAVVRLITWLLP